MSEFYGVFSNYEIEDVYKFIGTEKLEKRLKELKSIPTMGTTLKDFVSKDIKYLGVGVINIFNMILDYFPDDLDLAIFLYNKSKHYNESNYFSSQKQKKQRIEYIEMINKMILRGDEVEYYKAKLNSPFWLEIHFFYMALINLFVKKQKEINLLNFNIEGNYKVEKNKLIKDDIVLEIKKRRSPGIGNYLSVKSAPNINRTWFDLLLISNNGEVEYKFNKNSCYYTLKVNSEDSTIKLLSGSATKDELRLIDTNLGQIAREMTINYINNFTSISNIVFMDFGQKLANGFVTYASNFFDKKDDLNANLIRLNDSHGNIWLPS
jgi:hypothetical protein